MRSKVTFIPFIEQVCVCVYVYRNIINGHPIICGDLFYALFPFHSLLTSYRIRLSLQEIKKYSRKSAEDKES